MVNVFALSIQTKMKRFLGMSSCLARFCDKVLNKCQGNASVTRLMKRVHRTRTNEGEIGSRKDWTTMEN